MRCKITVFALIFTLFAFCGTAHAAEQSEIRSFVGTDSTENYEFAGWTKISASWKDIQKDKGSFDSAAIQRVKTAVQKVREQGKNALVVLENPPVWAAEGKAYGFTKSGKSYTLGYWEGIRYGNLLKTVTEQKEGSLPGESRIAVPAAKQKLSAEGEQEWLAFVKKMTDELTKIGVEYFQIYDMPFGKAEDFYGSDADFMEKIHIPAAEVIRNSGAKVVGGGVRNTEAESFVNLLNRFGWDKFDVINLYDAPLSVMNYVYEAGKQKGISPSIWQTQVSFENGESYLPYFLLRSFHWSLARAEKRDQFKIFWAENRNDGVSLPLADDEGLTDFGKVFSSAAKLLSGESIEPFGNYTTQFDLKPQILNNVSASEGFLIDGKKAVIAVHMTKQNNAAIFSSEDYDSLHMGFFNAFVDMYVSGVSKNSTVRRESVLGSGWEINHSFTDDGRMYFVGTVQDTQDAPQFGLALEAQILNDKEYTWSFYEVIESRDEIQNGELTPIRASMGR